MQTILSLLTNKRRGLDGGLLTVGAIEMLWRPFCLRRGHSPGQPATPGPLCRCQLPNLLDNPYTAEKVELGRLFHFDARMSPFRPMSLQQLPPPPQLAGRTHCHPFGDRAQATGAMLTISPPPYHSKLTGKATQAKRIGSQNSGVGRRWRQSGQSPRNGLADSRLCGTLQSCLRQRLPLWDDRAEGQPPISAHRQPECALWTPICAAIRRPSAAAGHLSGAGTLQRQGGLPQLVG